MTTIALLQGAMILILALIVATQIVAPAIAGRPLFPLLRKKRRDVERRIIQAREDQDIAAHEVMLRDIQQNTWTNDGDKQ